MPHFDSIPALDDLAPENLLPPTPKRGPKPPVAKFYTPAESQPGYRGGVLPRISIRKYKPLHEQYHDMDRLMQERLSQGR